jgi:hypothetical protein
MTLLTLLVKSEKMWKICLGCVDESKQWIRPIKPGGFDEKDILMDNGQVMSLFDVVDMKLGPPYPMNNHKENFLIAPDTSVRFVKKLSEGEQTNLLFEIADPLLLDTVRTKEELYDEMSINLSQSLILTGPINEFDIQVLVGRNHPQIWIISQDDGRRVFPITCTDIRFCKFVRDKLDVFGESENIISSRDVSALSDRQTYLAIGLTGDSLEKNYEIKDRRYPPPGGSKVPRYWPLVVSVLTVPNYSNEG